MPTQGLAPFHVQVMSHDAAFSHSLYGGQGSFSQHFKAQIRKQDCSAPTDTAPARGVSLTVLPSCHLVVMRAVLQKARPCSRALNGLQSRTATSLEFQVSYLLLHHPHIGTCRVWVEQACGVWCGTVDLRSSARRLSRMLAQASGGGASAESEDHPSTSGSDPKLEQEKPRHSLYGSILRGGLAAEAATSQLYAGQRAAGCSQPDVRLFQACPEAAPHTARNDQNLSQCCNTAARLASCMSLLTCPASAQRHSPCTSQTAAWA